MVRLDQHRKGRQFKAPGAVSRQAVVYMLQRADAKARDVRHDQLAALGEAGLQPLCQQIETEADALVGDLQRPAAAELRQLMIGQHHALAQVIGNHGRLAAMPAAVSRQRHHGRCFACAEKAADDRKFLHLHRKTILFLTVLYGAKSRRVKILFLL